MNQLANVTSPGNVPSLPDEWIERVFRRMEDYYLSKWVDSFGSIPRERVKRAWSEELAGYSAQEIKRGLDSCRSRAWPPTLPEFLTLCRPVRDAKTEWAEACEQMRIRLEGRGKDTWSRPGVYWAAVEIGWYDLNSMAWEQVRSRWTAALANAKDESIPEYRAALPSPGKETVTRDEATKRVKQLWKVVAEFPGSIEPNTRWAVRLMEREAGGESINPIAAQSWREVLGYPRDWDAKTALEDSQKDAA